MVRLGLFAAIFAAGSTLHAINQGSVPPVGAKSMQEIVADLENVGYLPVGVAFDDGIWEVDGYQEQVAAELQVDPLSRKLLSVRRDDADPAPPTGSLPLSKILESISGAGYTTIVEAEFKHGQWEIEAYRQEMKRELSVDPATGTILSDRAD